MHYDPHPCVFHILLMSDGLAHRRSISVLKIFEMIKQLSNVIFYIVIASNIGIHNFTYAHAMDTAEIPFGHLQTFPYCKNRKFRENVVTARAESIFTVYGKMFSSCICNSATDLLQFHKTFL